eukprot:8834139-Heterocapsa_arctica.AAC.1
MDAIIRSMPIECRFDVCMYDVKDEHQTLLHKPWRLNTNSVRLLRPLSRCCDKSHAHGLTHGAAAVQSGYYSDMM